MQSWGAAAAMQVTVVVPTGKNDPDDGTQVTRPHKAGKCRSGIIDRSAHWFGSFGTVILAGQVKTQSLPVAPLQVDTINL